MGRDCHCSHLNETSQFFEFCRSIWLYWPPALWAMQLSQSKTQAPRLIGSLDGQIAIFWVYGIQCYLNPNTKQLMWHFIFQNLFPSFSSNVVIRWLTWWGGKRGPKCNSGVFRGKSVNFFFRKKKKISTITYFKKIYQSKFSWKKNLKIFTGNKESILFFKIKS